MIYLALLKVLTPVQTNYILSTVLRLLILHIKLGSVKINSYTECYYWIYSPTLISFIAAARTSCDAWNTLALTYGMPSCGRITQLKTQIRNLVKGSQSIIELMQFIKSKSDELALMNAPLDIEDLTIKILHGLDDDYKELARAIQPRDTAISYEELHAKLLNHEAHLAACKDTQITLLATTHLVSQSVASSRRQPYPPIAAHPPNSAHPIGGITMYLLVYVDDLILTRNNANALQGFINQLGVQFSIKDLGTLSYFLGVDVVPLQGAFVSLRRNICFIFLPKPIWRSRNLFKCLWPRPHLCTSLMAPLPRTLFYISKQLVVCNIYLLLNLILPLLLINSLSLYMLYNLFTGVVNRLLCYLNGGLNLLEFSKNPFEFATLAKWLLEFVSGITRLNDRARQDAAVLRLGFLKLDARAREDTRKIDLGVKEKAARLKHLATDRAQSDLKRVADQHWSDGALEADLRRADFIFRRRAMEDAYMALKVEDVLLFFPNIVVVPSNERSFSLKDKMGFITLKKNGKALDLFADEVTTDRMQAIQDVTRAIREA
ncbi:hypothetical protein ZIOFF_073570 [Zingiber officinale]|uniref:Reverse transcriptase Ty1/copia-type domain-containing protein n=1 Tax=Zingiber officinale TaxID=94328 RepID=A0A8J5C7K1_ZINOF|nr:hypothetical protein ZIOFF_073570 [Zingiber officinale]